MIGKLGAMRLRKLVWIYKYIFILDISFVFNISEASYLTELTLSRSYRLLLFWLHLKFCGIYFLILIMKYCNVLIDV